ncbi:DNA mismatch repair endonuclease MutL [Spirulina sp. 06S082]|uniref:DNA mismatch repair endonuclease MutL n=1 Tax=Spirulina sp. 06S082 TaxID=3110248 RepID=UPI002B1F6228|nr:DNA mismatch repair endonuclease MutL [Spirulina sp. 06S082]MEA5468317.1 DNA mismatch repair endonuclease MutL [Spirulina sp. 06S082]
MSPTIQSLPPEVINIIAAGEVIDSLASVVRELVENAIDAGATRLTLSMFPDLWRVQIADNGRGMDLTNLRFCAKPHSTSKIYTAEDLWKITSLGFRGEALHSLAQLSELEICSRSQLEEAGWRIKYDRDGKPIQEEITAIAPGTIVTVANLFGNIPVRRQGLPAKSQQLKEIQTIIHHLALCHPHIAWQVWQDEQLWFKIFPSKTVKEIIPQFLKRIHASDLHYLSVDVNPENAPLFPAKIELAIGLPDRCHRRRLDWVKVAVNGRFVRSPQLEQTIISSFAKTLPRDRYTLCFLHLTLDPGQIDWNRHPAKTEIYLHNLDLWREEIGKAIAQSLRMSPTDLGTTVNNQRIGKLLKVSEEQAGYHLDRRIEPQATIKNEMGLMALQAVAQVSKMYIVAEHSGGLWLVEQHIAHERVLYEQLQDAWQLVPIEPPMILSQLTPSQVEQLQRIGLEIESFGEEMWAIRTIPEMLATRSDRVDAILELSWGGDIREAQVATACRSAIRNGKPLTVPEMQTLLDRWKNTRNPRTCPHGRPIYLSLEESALSRFFRRHWVIGKSHGI